MQGLKSILLCFALLLTLSTNLQGQAKTTLKLGQEKIHSISLKKASQQLLSKHQFSALKIDGQGTLRPSGSYEIRFDPKRKRFIITDQWLMYPKIVQENNGDPSTMDGAAYLGNGIIVWCSGRCAACLPYYSRDTHSYRCAPGCPCYMTVEVPAEEVREVETPNGNHNMHNIQ